MTAETLLLNPAMRTRLRETQIEAEDAFWEVVARRFPEARTGDFGPLETVRLDEALRVAITTWVRDNTNIILIPSVAGDPRDYYTTVTECHCNDGMDFDNDHECSACCGCATVRPEDEGVVGDGTLAAPYRLAEVA